MNNSSDSTGFDDIDIYPMPLMIWVCYHPEMPNRFAIRFEENGATTWLFDDDSFDSDNRLKDDSVPMVFKSWTTAFRYLIDQGEEHISLCLHREHDESGRTLH